MKPLKRRPSAATSTAPTHGLGRQMCCAEAATSTASRIDCWSMSFISSCFHPDSDRRPRSFTESVPHRETRESRAFTADREFHPTLQDISVVCRTSRCCIRQATDVTPRLTDREQHHGANHQHRTDHAAGGESFVEKHQAHSDGDHRFKR